MLCARANRLRTDSIVTSASPSTWRTRTSWNSCSSFFTCLTAITSTPTGGDMTPDEDPVNGKRRMAAATSAIKNAPKNKSHRWRSNRRLIMSILLVPI